ncbi:ATP-binding cassette domain-containing protein [archaeon]|nr:MAG: ATP-binding cassette domain-containing protein [archaeon]
MGQEPVLFSGTVLDNLSYGRYDVNFTPLINLQHAMVLARQKQLQNGQLRLQRLLYSATHFHKNDDNKQRENNKAAGTEGKSNNGEFYKNTWAAPKKEGSKPKDQVEGDIELGLIVPQSGSGHNNEDEVPADIVSAAKFSHAHDFISKFSQKYDTIISTMGSGYMISGGQKQRLSVARAMLKQPKILLLDEATSALDAQSEHLIQQSIDSLTDRSGQQREQGSPIKYSADSRTTSTFVQQSRPTVIIVAHRLSTIVNADRIIVIEKGEVKEAGSHDHLMNLPNGLYRGLYLKQTTGQH